MYVNGDGVVLNGINKILLSMLRNLAQLVQGSQDKHDAGRQKSF